MDIKWKKWKLAVNYAAFFLSICLLAGTLLMGTGLIRAMRTMSVSPGDAFQSDYQNTKAFRQYMSNRLEDFIIMASGGSPYWYSGTSYSTGSWDTATTETAVTEVWDTEDDSSSADERKELHNSLKDDKNMLYQIAYDGKVLYTNTEEGVLDGGSGKMPEGYNFMLYFDGKEVYITKDGKGIDVYGDGYYREKNDWKVPGYKNFSMDSKSNKASVCIAVIQNPQIFVRANYADSGEEYVSNRLYWLKQDLGKLRNLIIIWIVFVVLFAASLIVTILKRKEIKKVHQYLANKTKKIWVEIKLLVLLGTAVFLLAAGADFLREIYWALQRTYETSSGYDFYNYRVTDSLFPFVSYLVAFLVCFWILYFLLNDIRFNGQPFRYSLCRRLGSSLYRMFNSRTLSMPVQRQIIYRYLPAFLCGAITLLLILILWVQCYRYGFLYDGITLILAVSLLSAAAAFAFQLWYARKNRQVAEDIAALTQQIKKIREGELHTEITVPQDPDLAEAAGNLNDIRNGLDIAVQEQIKSERMKVELVSNVSHDIKTPLTSIISYVDLMNQETDLPDHIKDYVRILENKSQRLKSMVQDVFEISKAASHQLPVKIETLDLGKLIRQTLADMSESIQESTLSIKTRIPEEPVYIRADGQRLYRVFQNLLQNALQYSMEHSRIFIRLETNGRLAAVSVKNISKYELPEHMDFSERFTRGDASRSDGGSGLGLSIAKSFVEACQGNFRIEINADLFVVTVEFPDITPTIN